MSLLLFLSCFLDISGLLFRSSYSKQSKGEENHKKKDQNRDSKSKRDSKNSILVSISGNMAEKFSDSLCSSENHFDLYFQKTRPEIYYFGHIEDQKLNFLLCMSRFTKNCTLKFITIYNALRYLNSLGDHFCSQKIESGIAKWTLLCFYAFLKLNKTSDLAGSEKTSVADSLIYLKRNFSPSHGPWHLEPTCLLILEKEIVKLTFMIFSNF